MIFALKKEDKYYYEISPQWKIYIILRCDIVAKLGISKTGDCITYKKTLDQAYDNYDLQKVSFASCFPYIK